MKKSLYLLLALVLALGTMGFGYSRWSQTIAVTGSVGTGQVCWEFVETATSLDEGPNYTGFGGNVFAGNKDWSVDPGLNPTTIHHLDKNIGWTDVIIVDPHNVSVTLNNIYPCYYNSIDTHEYNCGSLPVKLSEPVLTYPDPYYPAPGHTSPLTSMTLPAGSVVNILGHDQYGSISPVLEMRWMANLEGTQWEPGTEVETSWAVHVLQAAQQNFTYSFTISMTAVQWNEYARPGAY